MNNRVLNIFNAIQTLNMQKDPCCSSLGSIITISAQHLQEFTYKEIFKNLSSGTIAYKILTNNKKKEYTNKQLWCIAYGLVGTDLDQEIQANAKKNNTTEDVKMARSKAKLEANRKDSIKVFKYIKSNNKEVEDYKNWCKKTGFYKQYYTEHYTMHSAKVFLNLYK